MAATRTGSNDFQVSDPDFGTTIEVELIDRPAHATDEQLTAQTIAICRQAVLSSAADARVIAAVRTALEEAGAKPTDAPQTLADAVFWYAKRHIIYTPEVTLEAPFLPNLQLDTQLDQALTAPPDLLQMPQMRGDCPDFSMLVAAMLRTLGIYSQFKTIAADARQPHTYSHIYVMASLPGVGLYPLDASNGPEPGAEFASPTKSKTWPI